MFSAISFGIILAVAAVASTASVGTRDSVSEAVVDFPNITATQLLDDFEIEFITADVANFTHGPIKDPHMRYEMRYNWGKRVYNDRQVSYEANNNQWYAAQKVTLSLKYPKNGNGALISYMEVVVDQSSKTGQAYIAGGGVGYYFVNIIVEASNTYWFNYVAKIYGS